MYYVNKEKNLRFIDFENKTIHGSDMNEYYWKVSFKKLNDTQILVDFRNRINFNSKKKILLATFRDQELVFENNMIWKLY